VSDVTPLLLLRVDREATRHTDHPRHCHPPLDLKYLEAQLQPLLGGPVALLDGWLRPFRVASFIQEALAHRPRVAVIRAVTWCMEESVQVATALRRAGVVTIAVGQQVHHVQRTPFPGWEEAFDLWVLGEPEAEVPRQLRRLAAGEPLESLRAEAQRSLASGLTAQVVDPDALRPPHYTPQELRDYAFPFPVPGRPLRRWGYVLSSWGCPRPCRHCTLIVRKSVGRQLRERSIDSVVAEVAALKAAGAEAIAFEDDSLFCNRRRFLALCDALCRRGLTLPWMANARPDELDAERVAAARAAGAVLLKVGVDTGAPRLIEQIEKAEDGQAWLAATEAGFARLHHSGIGSVALFVIGLPGETVADATASMALARRIRPDYLQVQIYRPYPDVPLWESLPAAARTCGAEYHYLPAEANCSAIPTAQIPRLQRRFYRGFYLRPAYWGRHLARFWRHYLSTARDDRRRRGLPGVLRYLLNGA
jgi:anaerobic magnesium-protoporphyrin IX monomethyl ester cyclase